jgi:hypothetical protein
MTMLFDKKEYNRQHYQNNRDLYYAHVEKRRSAMYAEVNAYKESVGCQDPRCTQHEHLEHFCLDFDHLPKYNKFMNIADMIGRGYSMEKIWEEIEKCEVVCKMCHALRTHERKEVAKKKRCRLKKSKMN